MAVVEVTTQEGFDSALGRKTCVFFWAAWHEPSKPRGQMDEVFTKLAELHAGSLTFIKVEAEAVPEVSAKLEIAMVPTFVLLKGGASCDKLEGADPPALAKRVLALANERVAEKTVTAGVAGVAPDLEAKLKKLVSASPIMLFMKGDAQEPKCKFSRKMVEMLRGAGVEFGTFNILSDEDVRSGLKVYSKHSTFPQLYVKGVLVGGVDDTAKLAEDGDLKTKLALYAGVDPNNQAPAEVNTIAVRNRCKKLIARAETMVFMKGMPDAPRCGFSRSLVGLLREEEIDFDYFDILEDQDVRKELKDLSNWPTYPQLYVNGDLVGGLDIIKEMKSEGPLAPQLGVSTKEGLESRLKSLISSNAIMLFMKGTPDAPQCGFSRTSVGLLKDEGVEFGTFDILEDNQVRQGLKEFSNWPTYPQLYAGGELVGGLDIMKEMAQEGELGAALRPQS